MIKSIIEKLKTYKTDKQESIERQQLLDLISATKNQLNTIATGFNEVRDGDLTEYFIYEKRATELRYKYLLKLYSKKNFCEKTSLTEDTQMIG